MAGRKCRTCGKYRFATREAAEAVIARLSVVGRSEKRAYFAHGWWHITSKAAR